MDSEAALKKVKELAEEIIIQTNWIKQIGEDFNWDSPCGKNVIKVKKELKKIYNEFRYDEGCDCIMFIGRKDKLCQDCENRLKIEKIYGEGIKNEI